MANGLTAARTSPMEPAEFTVMRRARAEVRTRRINDMLSFVSVGGEGTGVKSSRCFFMYASEMAKSAASAAATTP